MTSTIPRPATPTAAGAASQQAVTTVTQVVFPGTTNHHGTLFGGEVLSMMDSAAFIAATRYCRKKVVTRKLSATEFSRPVPGGSIVELCAQVIGTGRTSMRVQVQLFTEDMYSESREMACTGEFVLVALDGLGRPTPVPPLPVSSKEKPISPKEGSEA